MVTNPDLPEEILTDIFSRLPTKSIGRCRSLSKTWLNLLSTPHFIKSHLAREKTRHEYIILIPPTNEIHSIETIRDDDNTVSRKLDLQGSWTDVLGSCDGLVLLLSQDDGEMFLANPITLEQARIPNPPLGLNNNERFSIYGFGYDSVGDDYKVIIVSFLSSESTDAFVDVYSVKTGLWKRIESPPYIYSDLDFPSGAYINGAIHLLAARTYESDCSLIAALDLSDEAFFEIPAPSGVDVEDFLDNYLLVVLGGCLCLIDAYSERGGMDAWVMREYGVANSWTKLRINGDCFVYSFRPLCVLGEEEEIVLVVTEARLFAYNAKDGMSRDLVVDGVSGGFVDGGIFVESLVSPAALLIKGVV